MAHVYRNAVYNVDNIDRQYERSFSIKVRGYTFDFKTDYGKYAVYAGRLSKSAKRRARALCLEWAYTIAAEARKRCPHYSGGLEKAIKVGATAILKNVESLPLSKMSVDVGVDGSSWHSDYDKQVVDYLLDKGFVSDALYAGPELAVYLHDYWDQLVTSDMPAMDRAERKSDYFGGVKVGSHFLTRAYAENKHQFHMEMYKIMRMSTADLMEDTAYFDVPYDLYEAKLADAEYADYQMDTEVPF